jgi:protein-L-isoaspartate(D-aspartate) O-methyltransferase
VLEIGTGSGYQLAVLLSITSRVYSVERMPALAEQSRKRLESIGYSSVTIITGDGTRGLPEHAPYDGIIVTSAAPSVPEPLKEQLADGGRLVIPIGSRFSQILYKIIRNGTEFTQEEITPCVFVPLIGEYGWK